MKKIRHLRNNVTEGESDCRLAMKAAIITVLACLAPLPSPGSSLRCYVCLPAIAGNRESRMTSVTWRTIIARTWKGSTESDFGECPDLSGRGKFLAVCDSVIHNTCLKVTNGHWTARTCSKLPYGKYTGCYKNESIVKCYTNMDLSNNTPTTAPAVYLLLMGSLLSLLSY